MHDQLKDAGVDTAAARLATLAYEALRAVNRSPASAVDGMIEQVLGDAELMLALMRQSRTSLHNAVYAYLAARVADMANEIGGASHESAERQQKSDRAPDATWSPTDTFVTRSPTA